MFKNKYGGNYEIVWRFSQVTMEWILTAFSGVISGLIASFFFFLILFCIKPKIKTSEEVAKKEEDGKTEYFIKVVNLSRSMFIDVEYTLNVCTDIPMPGTCHKPEVLIKTQRIKFSKEPITLINGYKKDSNDFAVWLRVDEDLQNLVKEKGSYLEFNITGKHNISNRTKAFTVKYFKSHIKVGEFFCGKSTKIQ